MKSDSKECERTYRSMEEFEEYFFPSVSLENLFSTLKRKLNLGADRSRYLNTSEDPTRGLLGFSQLDYPHTLSRDRLVEAITSFYEGREYECSSAGSEVITKVTASKGDEAYDITVESGSEEVRIRVTSSFKSALRGIVEDPE